MLRQVLTPQISKMIEAPIFGSGCVVRTLSFVQSRHYLYRGSSDCTDSISKVVSILRSPISTKLPKFLAIVRFFEIFVKKVAFENFSALF